MTGKGVTEIGMLSMNRSRNQTRSISGQEQGKAIQDFGQLLSKSGKGSFGNEGVKKVLEKDRTGTGEVANYQKESNGYIENKILRPVEDTETEADEKTLEQVAQFHGGMIQVITENLHITQVSLENAMLELGLDYGSLVEASNLAALYSQLTGQESTMELLVDPEFVELLQQVGKTGSELLEELQIPLDEMKSMEESIRKLAVEQPEFLKEFQAVLKKFMGEDSELEVKTVLGKPEETGKEILEEPLNQTETKENPDSNSLKEEQRATAPEKIQKQVETVVEVLGDEAAATVQEQAETETDGDRESDNVQLKPLVTAEEKPGTEEGAFEESSQKEQGNKNTAKIPEAEPGYSGVEKNSHVADIPEFVDKLKQTVDIKTIVDQIAQHTRTQGENGITRMEMQLNPANLGKLFIQITAHEGEVTAQILTKSEAVKEAIESQVTQLKENLIQQGVKITAVEVTVASHEFERNLENGQSWEQAGEQQQGEDTGKKNRGRKNLNLKEMTLDDLSGLMSEEALAAQIMLDNGNSVDMTA